ncbi:4,5-DOPA dioxygenase extradiol [Orbus hercynius]|uniref:4,5-DOPA dioxygenase extradiol n=1 Tax=Orbus hercynius TaxID=593135 RepID=A0A495RJD7_9GAMM|nr:class III extradiol ring-cleavage dioxygenase [Orbus hercynius]RKS87652.1 4,5-DOPA dioxygenase extradiol [Orbus hercynius]
MPAKLPVIFITHGSPMLAVEPGQTGPLLTELGQQLKQHDIHAIMVISAHWLSRGQARITASEHLTTIHDFGGFPDQLYQLQYPAHGAPEIAKQIQQTLQHSGLNVALDEMRGLDHGAWIPLQYLFPDADIAVTALSMPWPMDAKAAITFGQSLKDLRNQGILIIASGSMTHNLYDIGYDNNIEASYISPFINWVRHTITHHDLTAMANYRKLAPYAQQAHPTDEHFLPLLIALACSDNDEPITELDAGITYQALSMNNYIFGQY